MVLKYVRSIIQFSSGMLMFSFLKYYLDIQLSNIYHSIVKLEYWLKIKYKPAPSPLSNLQQHLVSSSPFYSQKSLATTHSMEHLVYYCLSRACFPLFSPTGPFLLLCFLILISIVLNLILMLGFKEPGAIAILISTSCFS